MIADYLLLRNMRSALARGLPEVRQCRPHAHTLSVAGGGPSLADTYREMTGVTAAINGSLGWLLRHDVVPNLCGIADPGPHMPDMIEADRRVRYYVSSLCDPGVFDKLRDCHVTVWHSTGQGWMLDEELHEQRPEWLQVGGGSTMGLKWINLGYVLGFRKFQLHGMDSSFRAEATHAYPAGAATWGARGDDVIDVLGYPTRLNYLEQVSDFLTLLGSMKSWEPRPELTVHGEGLLQDRYRAVCGC